MKTSELFVGAEVAHRQGKNWSTRRAIVLDTRTCSLLHGRFTVGAERSKYASVGVPVAVQDWGGQWRPMVVRPQTLISTWADYVDAKEAAEAERIRKATVEAEATARREAVIGSIRESLEALGLGWRDAAAQSYSVEFKSAEAFEVLAEALAVAVRDRVEVAA